MPKDLTKLILQIGILIGVLANIGGVLSIFGLPGTPLLGTGILIAGILVLTISLTIKHIIRLNNEITSLKGMLHHQIPVGFGRIHDVSQLDMSATQEIHVLGSGTETYFAIIYELLSTKKLRPGIKIHLGFRVGDSPDRFHKLLEYEKKWRHISEVYNIQIIYYPYLDFFFMMRGMVFDKKIGFVGFYHRIGDQTLGFDQQGIVIKTDDLIGTFFLENFLKIFSCITPFDSVSKALSQFGKQ